MGLGGAEHVSQHMATKTTLVVEKIQVTVAPIGTICLALPVIDPKYLIHKQQEKELLSWIKTHM